MTLCGSTRRTKGPLVDVHRLRALVQHRVRECELTRVTEHVPNLALLSSLQVLVVHQQVFEHLSKFTRMDRALVGNAQADEQVLSVGILELGQDSTHLLRSDRTRLARGLRRQGNRGGDHLHLDAQGA